MGVAEVFVSSKEVLEKGNVLRQQSVFPKGFRRGFIFGVTAVIPAFRLQHIDDVLTGHKVGKAATHSLAHLSLLVLHIQCDYGFPRFQQIENEEFHQIAFPLTGISEDEDVGGGLVLITLVKVYKDITSIFVLADVETFGIRLAGIVEGIEICHGVGGEHTLKLITKSIVPHRADAAEALLLAEQELINIELATHQLC